MSSEYPLLDLRDLWRDAQARLQEIEDLSKTLWKESEYTWLDMVIIRQHTTNAFVALGALPPAILEGITKDEADLQEWEEKTA